MLAFLVRLLFFLSIILAAAKLLRSLVRGPSRTRTSAADNHSLMVKDPICGMYLDPTLALRVDFRREALYFCSEACRQKFFAASS